MIVVGLLYSPANGVNYVLSAAPRICNVDTATASVGDSAKALYDLINPDKVDRYVEIRPGKIITIHLNTCYATETLTENYLSKSSRDKSDFMRQTLSRYPYLLRYLM